MVPRPIVLGVIHPGHQRDVHIVGGRADQHLADPGLEMPRGVCAPAQRPCRFNHHLDPGLTPGNFAGSVSEENWITFPFTSSDRASWVTSPGKRPWTESYLRT